jgi:hypothetical protein
MPPEAPAASSARDPGPQPTPSLTDPATVAGLHRQSMVLANVFFPAQVITALSLGEQATVTAVRLFLAQFREEAGGPRDAVEKVLLDQLIVAHLKIGELYALGAETAKLEFKQLYSNAAARLLGTVCQLVSTLASYRSSRRPRRRRPRKAARAPEQSAVDRPTSDVYPPMDDEKTAQQTGE